MATILKTPSGTWQAVIRRKGAKTVKKNFSRKTDAVSWAKMVDSEIDREEHTPEKKSLRLTYDELLSQYLEAADGLCSVSLNQQKKMPPALRMWGKHFGHLRLKDITAEVIEQTTDILAKRRKVSSAGKDLGAVSTSTVSRDLSTLGSLFKWAAKKRIISVSPMREVAKPSVHDQRERYLSNDELSRLIEAVDVSLSPELGVCVRLALFTGIRQGNLMALTWGRVNTSDLPVLHTTDEGRSFTIPPRHVLIPVTKNGLPHLAPLEGMALEAMRKWSKTRSFDGGRLVFPGRHNSYQPLDLRKPWETALKRAGIEGFRWHDLRHTFASLMLKSGASHIELAKLTGHRDLRSLMRYTHIAPEHSSSLVALMAEKLDLLKKDPMIA